MSSFVISIAFIGLLISIFIVELSAALRGRGIRITNWFTTVLILIILSAFIASTGSHDYTLASHAL